MKILDIILRIPGNRLHHHPKYWRFPCCCHHKSSSWNASHGAVMALFVLHICTYWGHSDITHTHRLRMPHQLPTVWFIWQGASFRFPLSTLQRIPTVGRMVIIDTHTISQALYVSICYQLFQLKDEFTADWLHIDSNLFRLTTPLTYFLFPLAWIICAYSLKRWVHTTAYEKVTWCQSWSPNIRTFTGHLDTGFSWFPCVYKRTLRWFPSFQVDTNASHVALPT